MFVMAMGHQPMNHNPMVLQLMKHLPIHLPHIGLLMLQVMYHHLAVSVKEHSSLSSHLRVTRRMESKKMDVIVVLATYLLRDMELQSQVMVLQHQVMVHLVEDFSLGVVGNKKELKRRGQ